MVTAADEPGDALSKARVAAIQLELDVTSGSFSFGRGVFVSEDGHALVGLASMCFEQKPKVLSAGRVELRTWKILGLFPGPSLALIKFDYRPKAWLRIAKNEPKIGDPISLIAMKPEAPWKEEIPPIVGPIMAKRSDLRSGHCRVPRFINVWSLGSGVSAEQSRSMVTGTFAVDQNGDLVAFGEGSWSGNGQTLILVCPVVDLSEDVERMMKANMVISHPLREADNPYDLATLSEEFRMMKDAANRRDVISARQVFANLLAKYPTSINLKLLQCDSTFSDAPKLLDLLEDSEPKALQVETLVARSKFSLGKEDLESTIRELESAIAISPKDYPRDRGSLAGFYARLGRLDDAERLYREALVGSPESIMLNEFFESVLTKQSKWDDIKKVENGLEHLYQIYQRK